VFFLLVEMQTDMRIRRIAPPIVPPIIGPLKDFHDRLPDLLELVADASCEVGLELLVNWLDALSGLLRVEVILATISLEPDVSEIDAEDDRVSAFSVVDAERRPESFELKICG